jgi:AICAR transformylase/IMP cyclohydrolase PurH
MALSRLLPGETEKNHEQDRQCTYTITQLGDLIFSCKVWQYTESNKLIVTKKKLQVIRKGNGEIVFVLTNI